MEVETFRRLFVAKRLRTDSLTLLLDEWCFQEGFFCNKGTPKKKSALWRADDVNEFILITPQNICKTTEWFRFL
jgi:hypothetical protein